MGTNLTVALDPAPQTGAEVYSKQNQQAQLDTREVVRCGQCQLRQYRPLSGNCRRCHVDLDAPPPSLAPAVGPASTAAGELRPGFEPGGEPGIETAEATGIQVPNVAAAIRNWRQRRGLSQRQLAERMQVPRTYVSKIENDKATPTIGTLQRMATAMQIGIQALLASSAAEIASPAADAFWLDLIAYLPSLQPGDLECLLATCRNLAQA